MKKSLFTSSMFFIMLLFPFYQSFAKSTAFNKLSPEQQSELWLSLVSATQVEDVKSSLTEALSEYSINEIVSRDNSNILHHTILNKTITQELLSLFISFKIDLNASNTVGHTPLMLSILQENEGIFNDLLSYPSIKVNQKDNASKTALHIAVIQSKTFMINSLLSRGAHIDAKDMNGWSPLFYATNNRNLSTTTQLLNKKASVNARSLADQTPLHLATNNNDKDMVELLLKYGADVNARDKFISDPSSPLDINQSKTAYDLDNAHIKINQMLLEKGAHNAFPYFENNVSLLTRYSFGVPFNNIMKGTSKPVSAQFVGLQINYHIKPSLSIFWSYDYGFDNNAYHFIKMPGTLAGIQQIFSLLSTSYKEEIKGPAKNLFYTILGLSLFLPQGMSWDIYPASLQQWMNFSIVLTFAEANYVVAKGKNTFDSPFLVDISTLLGAKINFLLGQHTLAVLSTNIGISYGNISFVWNIGFSLGYLF